ncbi:hypothetical protein DFH06DRAFT_1337980 [Mycena polygramma]|nr:hypothetical protein DFH06DRAFT_1337980 [Mycena polygramma]
MQIGTKTRYTLDLDNVMTFPDNNHIPMRPPAPDERWVILTEVLSNPAPRPGGRGFLVKDTNGDTFPVVFATRTPIKDTRPYKQGRVLCLANGSTSDFKPRLGYIVRDRLSAFVRSFLWLLPSSRDSGLILLIRCYRALSRRYVDYTRAYARRARQASLDNAVTSAKSGLGCVVVAVGRAIAERNASAGTGMRMGIRKNAEPSRR